MIGRGRNVLLVDSAEVMRNLIAGMLRVQGFEKIAMCGAIPDAIHHARSTNFDLVIIDWTVDDLPGVDFARDIRAGTYATPANTPIIMMIAKAEPQLVMAARDLSIDALLAKPLTKIELDKKITFVLEKPRVAIKR
jgi:two-component system, chemotaxis family, chemotaxis protein CheY